MILISVLLLLQSCFGFVANGFVLFLTGKVLPSILLSHGVHCRLEDICPQKNVWLRDVEFQWNGKTVKRVAGDKVPGSIMPAWRKLRKEQPELFQDMRVWQQPCANCDSIIWRWQLELEASEFRQAVRVTDCLGSVWTEASKEAAFLMQQVNCPVAPGCTPLQQPTDTHLAKPAKDAGRAKKEELRELMRLAALKLKKPVQYKSTAREILLVALAMNSGMVALNRKSATVLQACRAGGWLAYRPDSSGKLQKADTEVWAQVHPQAAGRVSAAQLANRYDWLDADGKPCMLPEEAKAWLEEAKEKSAWHDPQAQPEEDCLDLEAEVAHLETDEDYQAALAASLHPAHRSDAALMQQVEQLGWYQEMLKQQEAEQQQSKTAEGATTASPGKKPSGAQRAKPKKKAARVLRSALAAKFKDKMAEAGGADSRLALLKPQATSAKHKAALTQKAGKSKKKAKKNAQKQKKLSLAVKNGLVGKFRLAYLARKAAKKAARKAAKNDPANAAQAAAAQGVLGETGGPLTGQQVRLVACGLPDLIRNSIAKVTTHYLTGLVVVELISGSARTFSELDLYPVTGKEKLPMPERLPALTQVEKKMQQAALAASGAQLDCKLQKKSLLESPEIASAWHEIGFRAHCAGDTWPNAMAVCLNPQEADWYMHNFAKAPGSAESSQAVHLLRNQCSSVMSGLGEQGFIQLPICAGGHWTLLTFHRLPEEPKLQVMYRDALPKLHQACLKKAQLGLQIMSEVLGKDNLSVQAIPDRTPGHVQPDATSCGYYVLAFMEEDYRCLRGEGRFVLSDNWHKKAGELNKWNKNVLTAKPKAKAKAKAKALAASSAEPAAAPALPAAPAPLPAPSAEPAPPPALPAAPAGPVIALAGSWGCSRCRWSEAGCSSCCPEKMARFAAKETGEASAQGELAALALPMAKRRRRG